MRCMRACVAAFADRWHHWSQCQWSALGRGVRQMLVMGPLGIGPGTALSIYVLLHQDAYKQASRRSPAPSPKSPCGRRRRPEGASQPSKAGASQGVHDLKTQLLSSPVAYLLRAAAINVPYECMPCKPALMVYRFVFLPLLTMPPDLHLPALRPRSHTRQPSNVLLSHSSKDRRGFVAKVGGARPSEGKQQCGAVC